MSEEDIKKYTVIVADGSGCLFQPMNGDEYTYILTAKHIFEGETEDNNGRPEKYSKNDGDVIEISQLKFDGDVWKDCPIKFKFQRDINYFAHKNADAAILKIEFKPEFDKIIIQDHFENEIKYVLSGCPNTLRNKSKTEWQTTREVKRFKASGNYCHGAQLSEVLNQNVIEGMSGGAIIKISGDNLLIAGVQSKMANSQFPVGEIGFIPIKFYNEIVDYPENKTKLTPLLPPYMASFDVLRNEVMKLEEAMTPNFKQKVDNAFNERISSIKVCPNDLYTSNIKDYLLANREKEAALLTKQIWISWFEYLIVLSILKDKNIDVKEIEVFFNEKRLIHSNTSKSWIEILPEILYSNLDNMNKDGVLVVSTKKSPLGKKRIKKGYIENIANTTNFDEGLDIGRVKKIQNLKEIIHIKAFEIDCIIANEETLSDFSNFQITELIEEIKNKIYEFFED